LPSASLRVGGFYSLASLFKATPYPGFFMRKFLNGLYTLGGWLGAGCIAAICLLVVSQVGLNLIDRISTATTGHAIGMTIPSYADFTGFLLAAGAFLSLAWTLRQGGHIRVSLVTSHLPERFQSWVDIWCLAVASAVTAYFTWYTALLVQESWSYHDLSAGMIAVPLWIPQFFMFFGLLILTVALIDDFVLSVTGHLPVSSRKAGAEDVTGNEEGI
jgi:TRAP-type C4-dicarboxylate transport system permease small subunit